MTIQERLRRSNLVMLVVPVVIAGVLFAAGLGALALLLNAVYLPRLGLTFQDLHSMGEEMEQVFRGLKLFVVLYAAVVLAALLAAVAFTNLYLTRALFAHIQKPLDILLQGVQRIQNGDLETPICYQEADEFRPACDAVDAMAVQLRDSLQQQREQQKKQELIAGMSHDLKSPLTTIRAYTEALLEGVAPDEAARQRYLQTIYARETDLEALVNRLFELAKLGIREYPARLQPLQLIYLFCSGAVAITAMVLPGISGSSILLIAGVYQLSSERETERARPLKIKAFAAVLLIRKNQRMHCKCFFVFEFYTSGCTLPWAARNSAASSGMSSRSSSLPTSTLRGGFLNSISYRMGTIYRVIRVA